MILSFVATGQVPSRRALDDVQLSPCVQPIEISNNVSNGICWNWKTVDPDVPCTVPLSPPPGGAVRGL